jgi:hypothetical protein
MYLRLLLPLWYSEWFLNCLLQFCIAIWQCSCPTWWLRHVMPDCKDRAESAKVFRVDVRIGPSERTFIVFSFFINPWLCIFSCFHYMTRFSACPWPHRTKGSDACIWRLIVRCVLAFARTAWTRDQRLLLCCSRWMISARALKIFVWVLLAKIVTK